MDIEEVAASMGISCPSCKYGSSICLKGKKNTLLDVLENPNAEKTDGDLVINESLKTEIERSLSTLTERQKEVICFFFGIGVDHPMSLEDIGEKLA